jgi:Domain of unknown function (DUF4175)
MGPHKATLNRLIDRVRLRLKVRRAMKGVLVTTVIGCATLVIAAAAASPAGGKSFMLFCLRWLPVLATLISVWVFIARPLRVRLTDTQIARFIEEKSQRAYKLADRLVTAVEYREDRREASPAIVERLVEDASSRTGGVSPDSIVDRRKSMAFAGGAALCIVALVLTLFVGPARLSDGVAALYSPLGDKVSASATFINVSPGTARVPRGSDQKIKAVLTGFDTPIAQVFIRKLDSSDWVGAQMEPAKEYDAFQHVLFNIQDSVSYYIEAAGIRSPEFTLEVADLAFVKQIDLVLDYPDYTGLPNKKIESGGEVAALKGTVVTVVANLSANAKSARILMDDGAKSDMAPQAQDRFVGQFKVERNGTYRIELVSEDGERYNGSNEYDITLVDDHPPTVVIDKPGRDMKVTSIQEVFAQARADDDFGVTSLEMYYSVNGGEEKRIQLQDLKNDSPKALSGAHTFFLEEYSLQPGDFISYYAKARDNSGASGGQESTSDIYFLEVRPFDRQFRQAQQQGGGDGEDDSNALTRRQREIIAATFRVQREQQQYTPPEKDENFGAVSLSQEKLKTDTDALVERIKRRLGDQLGSQPDFAKLVEYLTQASTEMISATQELKARNTKGALPPEQRSLQQLLRAEAIFRDIQISRGNQGGGKSNQDEQELADLFELQLDKMKNQYETMQRDQKANRTQKEDDITRRLQELARRQQQQVEQRMREQAQQQQGGGGGGGSRQQQEMVDEAQKLARELERLSRDRRDPQMAETARQLQQAADEMKRAQAASSSNSQQGAADATAQSLRALQRLEQARQSLESAQRAGNQQSLQKLRQQAEEALKQQQEIGRGVEDLAREKARSGTASDAGKQQVNERKDALADKLQGLERDIDQTARGMGQDRQQAADKLREAAGGMRRNRITDRIRQNEMLIDNGWLDQARDREKIIEGNIDEMLKSLQAAEGSPAQANQTASLADALNQARELADNLESLRRRLESNREPAQEGNGQNQQQGQQNGQQQGRGEQGSQQAQGQQQAGQQGQQAGRQGQQQGRQNSQGQQGRNQGGRQPGSGAQQPSPQQPAGQQASGQQPSGRQSGSQPGRGQQAQGQNGTQTGSQAEAGGNPQDGRQAGRPNASQSEDTRSAGGPPRPGSRQLESELRQRVAEAEELRRALGRNSDLARDLGRAIEQLRRLNPDVFADPSQLALLKNEVIDPLRLLEIELARRLQARIGNNGVGFTEADAPDRYRKIIEEYYRRLSSRSPEPRP